MTRNPIRILPLLLALAAGPTLPAAVAWESKLPEDLRLSGDLMYVVLKAGDDPAKTLMLDLGKIKARYQWVKKQPSSVVDKREDDIAFKVVALMPLRKECVALERDMLAKAAAWSAARRSSAGEADKTRARDAANTAKKAYFDAKAKYLEKAKVVTDMLDEYGQLLDPANLLLLGTEVPSDW